LPHDTAREICDGAAVSESIEPITPPRRRGVLSGKRMLLGMLAIVGAAFVFLVVTFVTRPPDPKLADLGEVPAFSLTDERAQTFTQEALRGRVTVVGFIFTRCDSICPTTTATMARIQEKTEDVGDRVKLVSFTMDPAFDSPPVLAAYAAKFHADPERWRFLTGPVETIRALAEHTFMFGMPRAADKAGGVPNIVHRGLFFLVDGSLHVRGFYDYQDLPALEELIRDARFLARTTT
jgi:protein SCO1/2